jgi:hypothetical protein
MGERPERAYPESPGEFHGLSVPAMVRSPAFAPGDSLKGRRDHGSKIGSEAPRIHRDPR